MNHTLFHFNIGKYEIGMYRHFKTWYFYNGYIREFMWWYIYHDKSATPA